MRNRFHELRLETVPGTFAPLHWPEFRADDVEQARAEHARGDSLELDAAFAGLAGCDLATWRKRVEEHRRAC